jgi:hypothetical protein
VIANRQNYFFITSLYLKGYGHGLAITACPIYNKAERVNWSLPIPIPARLPILAQLTPNFQHFYNCLSIRFVANSLQIRYKSVTRGDFMEQKNHLEEQLNQIILALNPQQLRLSYQYSMKLKDFALYTGLGVQALRSAIYSGDLPASRPCGRHLVIRREEGEKWIKKHDLNVKGGASAVLATQRNDHGGIR